MEESRKKVLFENLTKEESKQDLKNEELKTIFEREKTEMHQETARNLEDFLDDIVNESLNGINLEDFTKEDEDETK
jgi:hypothetical protein